MILFGLILLCATNASAGTDVLSYVDPHIKGGKVFQGAMVPWGMIQWGPSRWGYSLTFLSGASMPKQYTHHLPMEIRTNDLFEGKASVTTAPGYLKETRANGATIELTTTPRAGIAKLVLPAGSNLVFRFNPDGETGTKPGDTSMQRRLDAPALRGWLNRGDTKLYFVMRFSQPLARVEGLGRDVRKTTVGFDPRSSAPIFMKIGLSYASLANAARNLDAEIPGWDFEEIRAKAQAEWRKRLELIRVDGGTEKQKTMLYTALYHVFMQPNVFSDVNGEYIGFDDAVHTAVGHNVYANYSGWDIYRTWVQLAALLAPDRVSDMMQTLVLNADQARGGMPRWSVANRETGVMDDGSATPIVASAYAFGAKNFDARRALEILDRMESQPHLMCQKYEVHVGLWEYLAHGYIPLDLDDQYGKQSAATTLEYAVGDFALAQFARALGEAGTARYYSRLAQNWKNLWDPQTGFIAPRLADGSFWSRFDPKDGHFKGFTEGTSYQYTWFVPHNLRGLFDRMGGDTRARRRLDRFFKKLNDDWDSEYSYMGNEPGFGTPWAYNWAGAPWKTQKLVRRVLDELYLGKLPGDDDLGATSAWAIWASMGLYPMMPGLPGLALNSPIFPKMTLTLGEGKTLEIRAPGADQGKIYIRGVRVNGKELRTPWIGLSDLLSQEHNVIEYELIDVPSLVWGASREAAPPSFDEF